MFVGVVPSDSCTNGSNPAVKKGYPPTLASLVCLLFAHQNEHRCLRDHGRGPVLMLFRSVVRCPGPSKGRRRCPFTIHHAVGRVRSSLSSNIVVRVYRAGPLVPVFKQPRIRAAEDHEAFDEVEDGAILSLYVCGPARTVCTQQ